jgi:transcriptional regulator with GAF, ATPase, and Fis domain
MERYSIFDHAQRHDLPENSSPVIEAAEVVAVPAALDQKLQTLAERARYITQATGVAIALAEEPGGLMVCRARAGESAPGYGARLHVYQGLSGEAVASGRIVRCDQASHDGRANREICRALGVESVMVAAVAVQGEIAGIVTLLSETPFAFQEREAKTLEQLERAVEVELARAQRIELGAAVTPKQAEAADSLALIAPQRIQPQEWFQPAAGEVPEFVARVARENGDRERESKGRMAGGGERIEA